MSDYVDQAKLDDLWSFAQPPAEEARRLRDRGAQQALDGADTRGRLAGEEAIRKLARIGEPFTAEDVRDIVGAPLACRDGVLGALILAAAKRGEIEGLGYVQATRPEAHGRPLRIWRGTGKAPKAASTPSRAKLSRQPEQAEHVEATAGEWTAADVPGPCTRCGAPAFMRLNGRPRHKADCAGGS